MACKRLTAVASPVAEPGLWGFSGRGTWALEHRLQSCGTLGLVAPKPLLDHLYMSVNV